MEPLTTSTWSFETALSSVVSVLTFIALIVVMLGIAGVFGYMIFQWWKHRRREDYALGFVTLLVRLPRDNETKIDAAEQMFAGLYSLKKSGWLAFTKPEELISFEIVALKESIKFYVNCPKKNRDLVEKQINGAYPNAEITEVDEINIFSEKGRVAFASIKLDKANYYPIKTYKDLPTDGLSLITSGLSKMGEGEGAIIQLLIQPENKNPMSVVDFINGSKPIHGEKVN